MKTVKSVAEVKQNFEDFKVYEGTRLVFKTAKRTIEGYDKKFNIVYPVLVPSNMNQAGIVKYFSALENTPHDIVKLVRKGISLYFSDYSINNKDLYPSRYTSNSSKAVTTEYMVSYAIKNGLQLSDLQKADTMVAIQEAFNEDQKNGKGNTEKLVVCDDNFARELDSFADAILNNRRPEKELEI